MGPECQRCYAMKLAGTRLKHHPLYAGTTVAGKAGPVFNGHLTSSPGDADVWTWPLRWRGAKAPKLGPGKPSLIFVDDMSDLFHEQRPHELIWRTLAPILYSPHIGQLLTKRPAVMRDRLLWLLHSSYWKAMRHPIEGRAFLAGDVPTSFEEAFVPRLWLGFSAGGQRWFDERWPHMRELAAMGFTIFCSYEPALEALDLPADFLVFGGRAQLIAGGESGNGARAAHPDWFRHVGKQCMDAGVAFFFKQWGEHEPISSLPTGQEAGCDGFNLVHGHLFHRVGKKAAGRLLDGVGHNGFPTVEARAS
jgi:protein gp37